MSHKPYLCSQATRGPPLNYSRSRFRIRFRWLPAFPLLIPQKMAVCCWLVCSLFLFALGLKTSLGEGGKYTIKQSKYYADPFLSFIIWIWFLGARDIRRKPYLATYLCSVRYERGFRANSRKHLHWSLVASFPLVMVYG